MRACSQQFSWAGLAATLLELAKEDFDGFECYHSGHSREDTAALLTYCRQHQLVSGGSDCHGSFVPSVRWAGLLSTAAT
ncbi:MAG: hypothetical protein ACLR2G_04325 [Phascolarctobacterium faecium]